MRDIASSAPVPAYDLEVAGLGKAFEPDGTPLDDAYERRAGRFLTEYEWYANALKEARAKGLPR